MNAWQILLILAAALIALLTAILLLRVWVGVCYFDGAFSVRLKILGVSFRIYPRKEKKFRIKDHLPKRKKPQKKSPSKKKKAASSPEKKKRKPVEVFAFYRSLVTQAVLPALGKLKKHLIVRVEKMRISLHTADAAGTAVAYGTVSAGANALLHFFAETLRFSAKKDAFSLEAAYTAEETTADIVVYMGLRTWQALHVLLPAVLQYVKLAAERDGSERDAGTPESAQNRQNR